MGGLLANVGSKLAGSGALQKVGGALTGDKFAGIASAAGGVGGGVGQLLVVWHQALSLVLLLIQLSQVLVIL